MRLVPMRGTTALTIVKRIFPFVEWFKQLNANTLRIDFVAGLTVALVLVPQSMAYAQLAGLPAYYGLYAAFLPPMVANLFGSSRQLATGPVAVVSLMTAASLEPIATAGSEQYVAYAILLALMVGIFQLFLGIFRLGLIVNFLSHPVVNGFTNAAALIIATSQLSKIFGVSVDKAEHHYETVYRVIVQAIHSTHLPTFIMAVLAFATMIVLRRVNPRFPNVLAAVVLTTVLSWALGFERNVELALTQIESADVQELVHRFNAVIDSREKLEKLRTETNTVLAGMGQSGEVSCLSCHEPRSIDRFTASSAEESAGNERRILNLHHMAGLNDRQIETLKKQASQLRARLRDLDLVRIARPDGPPRFFVRGEMPPGFEPEAGRWRLRVGNRRLDTDSLTLMGGGAVVAGIPEGLPEFRFPRVDLAVVPKIMAAAVIISLLGFMEAISIAKAMAAKTRQRLDPDQELIGQGLANIIGCMGQSYAVSGSFSRSAVNLQAGARTGMANVFSSLVVLVVLLFFAESLYHLPQAVLAAIIIMAVFGLLNVSGFVHAWRARRFDGVVSIVAFVGTLTFAPHLEWGILLGVALSLGGYLYRTMRPAVAGVAPHPDGSLRDARRHGLASCKYLAVVRFDGPLNFASASFLEDELLGRVADLPDLRHLLIAGHGINELDASGEEMLRHVVERLRGAGYEVSFSGLKDEVIDVLRRTRLSERIGPDHMFPTQAQALGVLYAGAHTGRHEPDCPFRTVMPRVTEVSLHPDGALRDAKRHGLSLCQHIAALRFDDPLTFANTAFLEEEVLAIVRNRPDLRHVVLIAHGISDIDPSGAQKLCQLVSRLHDEGYEVSFSGFHDDVLEVLDRIDEDQVIGEGHRFPTQNLAIAGIWAQAHTGTCEERCPFEQLAPRLTELSLHPDGSLRDAHRHSLALCSCIALLRFDGPLVLASPNAVEAEFVKWVKTRLEVTYLLMAAHTIDRLDSLDAERLVHLVDRLRQAGYQVVFSGFRDRVFEVLGRSGVADRIGLEHIYATESLALAAIFASAHGEQPEESCPLSPMLPRISELSLHRDGSLRDAERHHLSKCRHIAAIRYDGPLNYATAGYFREELQRRLHDRPQLSHVLIACHAMTMIDATAVDELLCLVDQLRQQGHEVCFSGFQDSVLDVLAGIGALDQIGADSVHPTQAKAIEAIHAEAHRGSGEGRCPLLEVILAAG